MPYISTEDLKPSLMTNEIQQQAYNGLDCCVTFEVHAELNRIFNQEPEIYSFERALQGPYLEIMQRGFLVDQTSREMAARELRTRIEYLQQLLNELAEPVWGRGLNPRSPAQLKDFFYKWLALPEQWISQKGQRKLSTNREVLEKLEQYMYARPIIATILLIRDLSKQLQTFEIEIDSDGRFRTSYNIAGTESGRPSSSSNAFGTGGNAQNIAPSLRYPFIADKGWKLACIDLEQVEARDVGWFEGVLFGDWTFLNACESGDLHTNNSKLVWPELKWTGDSARDRKIAEGQFYREFSYRDMSKRGGHLSNYMGTAWTMSRHLKIPLKVAEEFQSRYCKGPNCAFPAHQRYWQWIAEQLQTTNKLVTPFGRTRHFFGRPGDDTTLREAIAFLPQSTTADRMNLGLWKVWKHMPEVQLLGQGFDSITFQYQGRDEDIIPKALELIRVELSDPASGRRYVVPGEAKIGWNWGAAVSMETINQDRGKGRKPLRPNPDGLIKWNPKHPDTRVRQTGFNRLIGT